MIINGNALHIPLGDETVDSIVCDPPYGLTFMGKDWDKGVPGEAFWRESLRVAKPGAHLLAFGGTRTYHRLTCAIEDAGWEIRDCIMWVYGSGFPKSHNIGKAIDKMAGVEREVVGDNPNSRPNCVGNKTRSLSGPITESSITAPATPEAQQWDGWGTALKPAWEPIIVARAPFKGTVAANVLEHGTGAINVDGCRVGTDVVGWGGGAAEGNTWNEKNSGLCKAGEARPASGRWPANLIHDGSDEVTAGFPETRARGNVSPEPQGSTPGQSVYGKFARRIVEPSAGDSGSASRFFYCAKPSRAERNAGLDGMPMGEPPASARSQPSDVRPSALGKPRANVHPTVKPIALMRYLCKLVTPPGGLVLDPFAGSGTTGIAAHLEGFRFVGIELDPEYAAIARRRVFHASGEDYQPEDTPKDTAPRRGQMGLF